MAGESCGLKRAGFGLVLGWPWVAVQLVRVGLGLV